MRKFDAIKIATGHTFSDSRIEFGKRMASLPAALKPLVMARTPITHKMIAELCPSLKPAARKELYATLQKTFASHCMGWKAMPGCYPAEGDGFALKSRPELWMHRTAGNLKEIRVKAVRAAANRALRFDALRVGFTSDPTKVGVRVSKVALGQYSSKCTYTQYQTTTTIGIPYLWRTRVERRGLAVVDGMMTLDAAPLDGGDGAELFAATWIVQRRGYECEAAQGFIARDGDLTYHAESIEKAIRGIAAKRRAAGRDPQVVEQASVAAFCTRILNRHSEQGIAVCVGDAAATGACDYGIRSWCGRTGLDYEAGCESLEAVVEAYRAVPMSEARRAILYAVRAK